MLNNYVSVFLDFFQKTDFDLLISITIFLFSTLWICTFICIIPALYFVLVHFLFFFWYFERAFNSFIFTFTLYVFKAANFPLISALSVPHRFWYLMFHYHYLEMFWFWFHFPFTKEMFKRMFLYPGRTVLKIFLS